jgi:predicted RNA-binding Zn ribbon-like protein
MTQTAPSRPTEESSRARPAALLIGDHVGLDFVNTTAAPRGAMIEWLSDGADLLAWLVSVAALDAPTARHLAAIWNPARIDQAAAEAVELREWFRGALEQHRAGSGFPPAVIERLNRLLERDAAYSEIGQPDADGHRPMLQRRHWSDPGQLLVPVAASLADLVCSGDWSLIHRCENPVCTLWFYDRTKGHRRRWCSQAMCGNRAKVAAFRERQRNER